jgi:hypothetical protein
VIHCGVVEGWQRVIRLRKTCPISEVPDVGEIVKAVEHL